MDGSESIGKVLEVKDLLNLNRKVVKIIQSEQLSKSELLLKSILEKFKTDEIEVLNKDDLNVLKSITYNNIACLYNKLNKIEL